MTEWLYLAHLIADNAAVGNMLMTLIAEDVGDPTAFDTALPLVRIDGAPTDARYICLPLRLANYQALVELRDGGPCTVLESRGASPEDAAQMQAGVHVITGTVGDMHVLGTVAALARFGFALPLPEEPAGVKDVAGVTV